MPGGEEAVPTGPWKHRWTDRAALLGVSPLGAQTSLSPEFLKLLNHVVLWILGYADPRLMSLPELVVFSDLDVDRSPASEAAKTGLLTETEPQVARLQVSNLCAARTYQGGSGTGETVAPAMHESGADKTP